jgi:hypothetical protein
MKKTKYIHTGEYHSALKRKESQSQTTTWMTLEDIMLQEIRQCSKDNTVWFHLSKLPKVAKFIETEGRMVVAKTWGNGK